MSVLLETENDRCERRLRALADAYEEMEKELVRMRKRLVEHHSISNLSSEVIMDGFGNPLGCPVCRRADQT